LSDNNKYSLNGSLTATLNGQSFTRGDTITAGGTVEQELSFFVGIEIIDPQSRIFERGVSAMTADNNIFTYTSKQASKRRLGGDDMAYCLLSQKGCAYIDSKGQ
jgi:hypothetical protein